MQWIKNWVRNVVREEIAAARAAEAKEIADAIRGNAPHIAELARKSVFDAISRP